MPANIYNNKIILIYMVEYSSLQLSLVHFSASHKQSYTCLLDRHNFHTKKDYKRSPYNYIQPLPNIKKINIFMYNEHLRTSFHCSNAAEPEYNETEKHLM
jgi:hypothetical protein